MKKDRLIKLAKTLQEKREKKYPVPKKTKDK